MRIAVAGDFHIRLDELRVTEEAMEDLAACHPDLVVPLGDFGSNDKIGGIEGLHQAHRYLRAIGAPLRPILGNHDLQRESGSGVQPQGTIEAAFRELYGLDSAYGVMELEHVRLFFVATEPQPPDSCYQVQECYVSDAQFEWLRAALTERPGVPCILFSHAPPIGSALRTVPHVHVRATNAYLDQNHDPGRWLDLIRSVPEIVVWLSAHYHLGHDHPDSSTERYGTRFFTTGVHAGVTRDGRRQSRLIELDGDRIAVYTVDHIRRTRIAEADWNGGSLRGLAERKRELLEGPAAIGGSCADTAEQGRPGSCAASNAAIDADALGGEPSAAPRKPLGSSAGGSSPLPRRLLGSPPGEDSPMPWRLLGSSAGESSPLPRRLHGSSAGESSPLPRKLYACSVGEPSAALRRIVPLAGGRCLVLTDDGMLWEADMPSEAVLGSHHIGMPPTDAVASEDGVWRAWGRTLARSDGHGPDRFQREPSAPKDEPRLEFDRDITHLSRGKDGSLWVVCGADLYEVTPGLENEGAVAERPNRDGLGADGRDSEGAGGGRKADGSTAYRVRPYPLAVPGDSLAIVKLVERDDGTLQWLDAGRRLWSRADRRSGAAPVRKGGFAAAWDAFGQEEAAIRRDGEGATTLHYSSPEGSRTLPLPLSARSEGPTDIVCLGGSSAVVLADGTVRLWRADAGSLTAVDAGPGRATAIARAGRGFFVATAATDAMPPQLQLWRAGCGR